MDKKYMKEEVCALKDLTTSLDAKLDSMNGVIGSWEKELHGVRIEAYTWPEAAEAAEDEPWQIGWSKLGGEWQLVARQVREEMIEEFSSISRSMYAPGGWPEDYLFKAAVPLRSAPRDVRLAALWKFHDLLDALKARLKRYHQMVDQSLAHVG